MKIGELAKATNENVSTIRFWTKIGLLEVADITTSNYQLYSLDAVEQCKKIQALKKQRLSINEIRDKL
ncbi:MAG TPA: MerR family transcriptional regulator [Rickettsia endosymbiont of Pyrocoelia pectoralis]|nr:MerR family transcriptional regulator [Rickettsia endosymbiont of Pyrocoelia pectoralis]